MILKNRHNVSVASATGTLCRVVGIALLAAAAFAFTSCKGRTLHNMVPAGDTVEVYPETITETPDSINPGAADSALTQPEIKTL